MKVSVTLPEPLSLRNLNEKVSLFVGLGQDLVTIDGNGNVTVTQNGGGGITYSINVLSLIKAIRSEAKLMEQPKE